MSDNVLLHLGEEPPFRPKLKTEDIKPALQTANCRKRD